MQNRIFRKNTELMNTVEKSRNWWARTYLNYLHLVLFSAGLNWVLVDTVYLERCKTNLDIQTWRNFFSKLGVTDVLSVREEKATVTHQDIVSVISWKLIVILIFLKTDLCFIGNLLSLMKKYFVMALGTDNIDIRNCWWDNLTNACFSFP